MRNYWRRVRRLTGDAIIDDQLRPARIRMDRNLVALYVLLEDWLVEDPERTLRFVAVRQASWPRARHHPCAYGAGDGN